MPLSASLLAALFLAPLQDDGAWPHLRGPNLDGSAADRGVIGTPFVLQPRWTAPIGPAYSGVAVGDGRAVTMMSDGNEDFMVALDAATGAELWRAAIGPAYLGHDGSEDGAISSPALGFGHAFVVGPRGTLFAMDAESGELAWSIDLTADFGVSAPEYGFVTSPLVEGDSLLVQVGGESQALCAFDPRTGELRWGVGAGEPNDASPVAMDLAGRRQVVVLNGEELFAVAPESGEVLWQVPAGGNASSGVATRIDGDRFCAYVSGQLATFGVVADEGETAVEPLYRTREIGRSYAAPVAFEGHLYGFNSSFLTCADAETGRRVWKSRPPGGSGLILVDGHLVVFGAEGVVAVAPASPEGFTELARLQALEHSSYVWPTFADGCVYVRNSAELACVRVSSGARQTLEPAAVADAAPESAFRRFVEHVEAAADAGALIDDWMATQPGFPVLEGDLVHFVHRADAEDVAVTGSMSPTGRPEPLTRVAGTDLFHRTYRIEPGARWEYGFQVDFGATIPDPLNPRTVPARRGELSELVTPEYAVETHFLPSERAERGRLEELEFAPETYGTRRTLQVYLPAGYDESETHYPLLVVHEGPAWIENGGLVNTLDNLAGRTVQPLVAVFVPPIDAWWYEAGGSETDAYLAALATELVPLLEERYRLSSAASDRALAGRQNFGMTAALGALRHHDVFGKAAVQSLTLQDLARHAIFESLEQEPRPEIEVVVDWNRYSRRDLDRALDIPGDSRRLHDALAARGVTVHGGEHLDAYGWGAWRSQADDWLEALFPAR